MIGLELDQDEILLLKKLTEEMYFWPGAGETPNGVKLSEKDDVRLWNIIHKIEKL